MATLGQTNQPVTTVVGTSSYTVPAGRWARVLISLSTAAKFTASLTMAAGNTSQQLGDGGSDSQSAELFLKSGDVLTSSLTNASGSPGESIASALVNSTVIATSRAQVSAAIGGSTTAGTISFSGSSSFGFIASEYLNTF